MLIPVVIAQTSNPVAELAIPTGSPTNEANVDVKTQPLIAEIKKENFQSNLKSCAIFFDFHSFNHHFFISSKRKFFVSSIF